MNQAVALPESEAVFPVGDYLRALYRRRWYFAFAAVTVFALGFLFTLSLPSSYRSNATILIEEQSVPRDFVTSTITSYATQQIQVVNRRILATESVREIAEKHSLFRDGDTGAYPSDSDLVNTFKEKMSLELVSADVINPQNGKPIETTIAFNLGFTHRNPKKAQLVANELVTRFLDESLRNRTEQAATTQEFLTEQAASLNEQLLAQEELIAKFKMEYDNSLPERHQYNLETLERSVREMSQLDARNRELQRQQAEAVQSMELISPHASIVLSEGQTQLSVEDSLRSLDSELRRLNTIYAPSHPDIRRVVREIEMLETQLAAEAESTDAQRAPTNPPYLAMQARLRSIEAEIRELRGARNELVTRRAEFQRRVDESPNVEKEYQALLRGYKSTQQKYEEIKSNQQQAELAESLEQDRKGGRFTLLEPPPLPQAPASPNRQALFLISLIAALMLGIGAAAVAEALDPAVYGERAVVALTGSRPIAVVGYINNSSDLERNQRVRKRFFLWMMVAVVVGLVVLHFAIRPLDILWFNVLTRLGF